MPTLRSQSGKKARNPRTTQQESQSATMDAERAGTAQIGSQSTSTATDRTGTVQIEMTTTASNQETFDATQTRSFVTTTETETCNPSDTAPTEETVKATLDKTFVKKKSMSRASTIQRNKALAEIEAKRKIAEIELLKIEKQQELAEMELACIQAHNYEEVEYEDSLVEDEEDGNTTEKIQRWLEKQRAINLQAAKEKTLQDTFVHDIKEKKKPENIQVKAEEVEEKVKPAPEAINQTEISTLTAAFTEALKTSARNPGKHIQELPIFNGRSDRWLSYRAAFRDTEEFFTRTENINRLRKSLRGPAAEAVMNILIGTPEPQQIIKALERRFGRPEGLIRREVEKVKKLRKITDNPLELCIFASKITNIVAAIEALEKENYLCNPDMLHIIVEKLTPILKSKWYDYDAAKKEDIPDLKKIATFLNEETDKCGPYAPLENIQGEDNMSFGTKRRAERTYTTAEKGNASSSNINKCPSCHRNHNLAECKDFIDADVNKRWEVAKKTKICFKCLRLGKHRSGQCRGKPCGIENCTYPHHRLLHNKKTKPTEDVVASTQITNAADLTEGRRSYLKIVPVTITGPNNTTAEVFALLDEGSTVTIIDESIIEDLGVNGPSSTMWVQGVGGLELKHEKSKMVDIQIKGKFSDQVHTLRRARTVKKLNFTTQAISEKEIQDCDHLQDIATHLMYNRASPKILIGQDNWELIVSRKIRTGRRDQPVASQTLLGWVLHGCRTSICEPINFCGHISMKEEQDNIETMMKKFFDLEALGIEAKKPKSDPEQRALQILENTSQRLPSGRFETGLLWKEDNIVIPNNYCQAKKRLLNLERKLDRDEDLKIKYEERIENLFQSGYAEPANTTVVEGKTWYLPHFAVVNPEKPKIRVVHDAAAKSYGCSLNDMLLSGPDLLQSLPGVIMRFRQHSYAITADIKEMFMQVKICEEDRDALRFLWRGNQRDNEPIQEYRMTSVIFGATSSPCTALYIKNRNALDFKEEYPEAAKVIERNHYMDDYICSFPTEEEAVSISQTVDRIHRKAGFELRGWVSNVKTIKQHFTTDPEITTVAIGGSNLEKTLGLQWELNEDCIGFRLNQRKTSIEVLEQKRLPTKREALSIIMSLFDPLGLVSPITMPAKRIMQETWRYGTGWDEPLPEELQSKWNNWLNTLRHIEKLRIPRCYDIEPAANYELHTFVDASEEAYAAAVYLRITRANGSMHISLIAGKSRVTPLKPISIPRLELQAAVLGVRLTKTVIQEHDFKFSRRIYWSDSRTALAWIRAEPRAFKTFVAHRLAEIEDDTKKNEWKWVPTKDNVADDATRSTPEDFDHNHRWFHGPNFLWRSEEEWPCEIKTTVEKTGEEKEKCGFIQEDLIQNEALPDIKRFSKWTRLIRATARVLQFLDLCKRKKQIITASRRKRTLAKPEKDTDWGSKKEKTKEKPKKSNVQIEDKFLGLEAYYLIKAEKMWIYASQQESFAKEIERIQKRKTPSSGDRLATLSVVLDTDNTLRLKGRIAATPEIDHETAHPAILDGEHRYSRLYIQHVHERLHHGGVELVVNELRQRFWIIRIRPTVKEVLKNCMTCRLKRAKPTTPYTGDLPASRLAHHARPFTFTGLDYFGPLEVTVGRHREKRYVALFTCMTSRAIHLEVVASLSADSAISALRRFMARRGCPKEIWSDNATCFKAADKELQMAASAMKNEATSHQTQWRFLPPSAPFMAGVWERMVRSVKEALRATLHEKSPRDETLHTLIVEAENTVNSRPLTHVSVSPEEPEALTPNHILLGTNSHVPVPGEFDEKDLDARQHWRRAQVLADIFWQRWVKEYLPILQHRREPRTAGSLPKVGDVVIICDSNLPRNVWPKGRVTKIFPGNDGEVRVVDVTTSNGHTFRRPTKKIVVLPVESQNCDGGRNVHDDV